jgi:hypothetical protein
MPHCVRAGPACSAADAFRDLVRFVVLTRTRSASTTFVTLLGDHPAVSAAYEVWRPNAGEFRVDLSASNKSAPVADCSGRFFGCCPTAVCGFKLKEEHMPIYWMSRTLAETGQSSPESCRHRPHQPCARARSDA